MMPAKRPAKDVVHSDTVTTEYTTNWSGVGNSNTLTKWNPKTSFDSVYSQFNVPVVQQAFDVCDGGYDWEVTWNGIDGFKNGTVLQGEVRRRRIARATAPSRSITPGSSGTRAYPIVEAFSVNPGDDMYVNSYSPNGGCNPGQVFVEDETTLAYGTYQLTWENGPCWWETERRSWWNVPTETTERTIRWRTTFGTLRCRGIGRSRARSFTPE